MRGVRKGTSTIMKRALLALKNQITASGGGGGGGVVIGGNGKNGDLRWLNTSMNGFNSFYQNIETNFRMISNSAQGFAPVVTISSVDPSSLVPGDVDIYIYGTNLDITTGVALKLDGLTYTVTNWAYESDAMGIPPNPQLFVELPLTISDFDVFGLFDIVITNSYGSTEFPEMVNYWENYV